MAWTAPATFSVSEVVTAAKLNTHIRDNLKYLKGQAGGVAIEDKLTVGAATTPAAALHASAASNSIIETIRLDNPNNIGSNGSKIGWRNAGQAGEAAFIQVYRNGSGVDMFMQLGTSSNWTTTDAAARMTIDGAGNFGIGTAAPQSRLHVAGVGGGFLYLSASAVTTLQTLAAAGTVTKGAVCWVSDVNNTTNTIVSSGLLAIPVNSLLTYTNTDTITVAVTAGGAITVQRTTGTNGTHNINMLVLYY